jgi:methyl-accepting chemotaxis protein
MNIPSTTSTARSERLKRRLLIAIGVAAFLLLTGFGFFLVYNLMGDMRRVADAIEINMETMASQMLQVSGNLDELTGSVRNISVNLDDLTGSVKNMGDTLVLISDDVDTLHPMLSNMGEIKVSLRIMDQHMDDMNQNIDIMNGQIGSMTNLMSSMTAATHYINQNVSGMNQNIGRPMSFMNSMMPW